MRSRVYEPRRRGLALLAQALNSAGYVGRRWEKLLWRILGLHHWLIAGDGSGKVDDIVWIPRLEHVALRSAFHVQDIINAAVDTPSLILDGISEAISKSG